ncbi:HD domain-containing protein [Gloeomargarita lithophora Alchichica-D10]|uniref:HD domain-containing protein n=1 Tax=Gloeomargarita lithophora Alchichica-D10 TaxID=1188229 RepID=A0A1J0AAJ8_9CYAN|nr:HD domain-containing protein [Gloeomargarita lithophora]APB32954.1 HD domain-containing protein [Gloeomargarita lithophora Alchichica-D10]
MLSFCFAQALIYAHELHQKQVRKGTSIPYISHLLAVSAIALEHGANQDQAIAALLHDSLEDAPQYSGRSRQMIESEIAEQFGAEVRRIVIGCTDTFGDGQKVDWWQRKIIYLQHLEQADEAVLLVSNADKFHNVQCIWRDYQNLGENLWARFTGGKIGTLWYYQNLAELFHRRRPSRLATDLQIVTDMMT